MGLARILGHASLDIIRPFANLLGGMVTAASAAFPWFVIGISNVPVFSFYMWNGGLSLNLDVYSLLVASLVVGGAASSVLSRYGGILTITGCLLYSGPPGALRGGLLNETDYYLFGFYLALEGAVISLLGSSLNTGLIDFLASKLRLGKGKQQTIQKGPLSRVVGIVTNSGKAGINRILV